MPLITCPECGNKISDKALNCPNCGCPIVRDEHACEWPDTAASVEEDADFEAVEPTGQSEGHSGRQAASPHHPDVDENKPMIDQGERSTTKNVSKSERDLSSKQRGGGRKKLGKGALALIAVGALELVVGVLLVMNVICIHEWSGNTCTEANHCVNCGKVDPDGKIDSDAHMWNEADCTKPRTCARCGLTDGKKNPSNHALEDRDGGGKICWKCGAVFGATTEDDSGNEKEDSADEASYETPATSDSVEESNIIDGRFSFAPNDFLQALKGNLDLDVIDESKEDLIAYIFVEDINSPKTCGMLSFTTMDGQTNLGDSYRYDTACNPSPILIIETDEYDSAEMTVAFIMACDPSLTRDDAVEVANSLADSISSDSGSTTHNGVEYLIAGDGDKVLLRAVVQ